MQEDPGREAPEKIPEETRKERPDHKKLRRMRGKNLKGVWLRQRIINATPFWLLSTQTHSLFK